MLPIGFINIIEELEARNNWIPWNYCDRPHKLTCDILKVLEKPGYVNTVKSDCRVAIYVDPNIGVASKQL